MQNTVLLNAAKLDFDNKLDFSPLTALVNLTKFSDSSETEILERVKDQTIIITKELPLGKELIAHFPPSVKMICEAGTGYNNIDIAAAKKKNIVVCNIPSYSTEAVAQLVITFILNLSSSLIQQQRMIQKNDFSNFTEFLKVPHFELQNKVLGVIGTGAIGSLVIKIAKTLGMNFLVYSRTPKIWEETNTRSVSLDELLRQSDFVSIHCPLNVKTKHLINKECLKLMKPSAYIINTARGPIIKETDLIEALENKVIAGAALDVQDPEPPNVASPLFRMHNVIMTPHIGWRRIETRQRLITLVADNIEAFLQGKARNAVNWE